ncbi:LCP family glycopolymer transferase [Virgibacillus alimentarius]|uniref:LCP family protein required for cell wall assembly n=2 Tax=Virgibacillus alimentarius TaxID=698769 RepID=A0ABS4S9X1_9BACI|nr:LCP family protein [Virgibacillus alimentarius]MBP2257795.1 LCP family protein required for cell wall assembly [Virgibacillus alimentarius]
MIIKNKHFAEERQIFLCTEGELNNMGRSKRRKSKKIWLIPLAILLLLVLGIGGYAFSLYNNAKNTVNNKMHDPVDSIDLNETKKKIKASKSLNILLMGVDARGADKGRSDALMVLTLNPKTDSMQIVSIPRDTRVEIAGRGTQDKINHAYAFGGADMAVNTVENFLDVDMDYYVSMNMEGMEELVDQLGGITVENDIEWQDKKYHFTKGTTELDGDKAMHFVRMRKQDPNGDFGRTTRQRKVIQGIIDKGASIGSVTKFDGMIDILGNNMATNMDFDDMKKLFSDYKNTRKKTENYQMEGTGTNIGGVYYMQVDDAEIQKVHSMIKDMKE